MRPVDYGAEQGIQQEQRNKQIALAGIGGRIVETVFYGVQEVAEVGTSVEVIGLVMAIPFRLLFSL